MLLPKTQKDAQILASPGHEKLPMSNTLKKLGHSASMFFQSLFTFFDNPLFSLLSPRIFIVFTFFAVLHRSRTPVVSKSLPKSFFVELADAKSITNCLSRVQTLPLSLSFSVSSSILKFSEENFSIK